MERGEKLLKRPSTTQLVSTRNKVSNILSSTLLTVWGSLEYAPSSALMEHLLSHSPTCPDPTKHNPLPDTTWESFRNMLNISSLTRRGGRTSRTTTLCTSPPPLIQQFVWWVCNRCLHQPLRAKWLEANIILLFKKVDVMNSVNYRPIALLNSLCKIIATHASRELLAAAIEHSIIQPSQFGGLPNRRCQDHIFKLLSEFRESVGTYSLYIQQGLQLRPSHHPFHGAETPELPDTPGKPHSVPIPCPSRLPGRVRAHPLLPPRDQAGPARMPHVAHPLLHLLERTPFRPAVPRHCTSLLTRIRPRLC